MTNKPKSRLSPGLRFVSVLALAARAAWAQTPGTGLKADYFPTVNLSGAPSVSRIDATVNFQWNNTGVAPGFPADRFSARWQGQIQVPVNTAYTFFTHSDDGVRLWVDGKLLINNWTSHSPIYDQSVPVTLDPAKKYDIQIEYFENTGSSTIQLLWSYAGQTRQVMPQTRLFPTAITLQPAPIPVSKVWLSDLNWLSATNGWGPVELDRSNGEKGSEDGRRIQINGRTYGHGLGVHARSEIRYAIDDRYDVFKAIVGLDDEVGPNGSVVFEVWGDGRRLFQSPVIKGDMPGLAIQVPVENVNTLTLIVTDAGDGIGSDHADWADARFEGIERVKYLSDLNWVRATNGSGPVERDRANGGATSRDGERLRMRGEVYRKGLGTFPVADIHYDLDKLYERFSAVVGIDDAAGTGGTAIFEVWNGTTRLYRSAMLRGGGPVEQISLNVSGVEDLFLKVLDGGDGAAKDFADWADAKLLPLGSDAPAVIPPAPTELTATAGNAQVKLIWKGSDAAAAYYIYRGTAANGQSTTPIATVQGASYTNSGLTNGTPYFFKVRGVSAAGTGAPSSEASATPAATPAPVPTTAPALSFTAGNAQVTLNWTAATGATSYSVFRNGSLLQAGVNALTFNNTGLTNGATYTYRVAGVNNAGAGPQSNQISATPIAAPIPTGTPTLTFTAGNAQVILNWTSVTGATFYNVYRNGTLLPGTVNALTFTNTGLTNGTAYTYRVAAGSPGGAGPLSNQISATPLQVLSVAPTLTGTPGNTQVSLSWTAVAGASGYRVFRGATAIVNSQAGLAYVNTGLTNGTAYAFTVAALNAAGEGPKSNELTLTPLAPPVAPTALTAVGGNTQITLNWAAVPGATSYNVYRGTAANGQGNTALMTNVPANTFVNTGVTNGTTFFYKVTAVNAVGESPRSAEASAAGLTPPPTIDPTMVSFSRLLRQATWGPKPGDVDRAMAQGRTAFLDQQFNTPASDYPDVLYDSVPEVTQEHFMRVALTGQDQLRQRIAWALHKIWVISGNDITRSDAIVTYQRILLNRAFGNYRDIMREITLNPAMGRYLNMLNNRSQAITGVAPNENYAREIEQLFTMGLTPLNPDGTPQTGAAPPYSEADVAALSRIFTGWTFGDGNPATIPTNLAGENWRVPMEAVERFHDTTAKTFLGANFIPGRTAAQDLDQALDVIFNHPNLPPFVSKQLIAQLVTSNPSPAYVSAVSAVFVNNGSSVRGDLRAVIRAILTHPEANLGANPQGKFMEPVLFVLSQTRALNANVADHPFMTDLVEEMGQKVFYPPSVFSYFSPGYRIRGTTLGGPEYQILTSVTALQRINFAGRLISNGFGADVGIDYSAFTSKAGDPAALVDYCNLLFMGGQMSTEQRNEIVSAVQVTPATNATERVRTAIYLTVGSAQYQVDR